MKHPSPDENSIIGNVDQVRVERAPLNPDHVTLIIDGWLIHTSRSIVDLYFEITDCPQPSITRIQRPDLAAQFPEAAYTIDSGYSIRIQLKGKTIPSPLIVRAFGLLDDGQKIQTDFEVPVTIEKNTPDTTVVDRSLAIALRNFLLNSERLKFSVPDPSVLDLSVVVVTYNRAAETLACLQAIAAQSNEKTEVIIVDNSTDIDVTHLLTRIDNAHIVKNETNVHFLAGANQGANLAKGKLLLFLNNDAVILPGALSSVRESFLDHPRLGVLGARLIHPNGKLQEVGAHVNADGSTSGIGVGEHPQAVGYLVQRSVDYCSGAFLATPLALWHEIGGFDPLFSPAYYEDVDYCYSVRERGYEILVEPRIAVIHYEGAIHADSTAARNLMLKNRALFCKKHSEPLRRAKSSSPRLSMLHPPEYADPRRVLLIDDFLPVQSTGQGAPRALAIVKTLLLNGYRPTCVALNEPVHNISRHIPGLEVVRLQGKDELLEFLALRGGSYGTIIVSRPHTMEYFLDIQSNNPICAKNAKIIYDAEAIFAQRELRKRAVIEGREFSIAEIEKIVSIEILKVKKADQIWVTSPTDQQEFLKRGIENVVVLSHGVEVPETIAPFESRHGILFIGPIQSADSPNGEGLSWFLEQVYPLLKQTKETVTHIGNDSISLLRKYPSIKQLGEISDTSIAYNEHAIFIAPIRFGAGISLKTIEAASRGIPIVATSFVAHQLNWSNNSELLVADSAKEFAEKITLLREDRQLWIRIQSGALNAVRQHFAFSTFSDQLLSLLNSATRVSSVGS